MTQTGERSHVFFCMPYTLCTLSCTVGRQCRQQDRETMEGMIVGIVCAFCGVKPQAEHTQARKDEASYTLS